MQVLRIITFNLCQSWMGTGFPLAMLSVNQLMSNRLTELAETFPSISCFLIQMSTSSPVLFSDTTCVVEELQKQTIIILIIIILLKKKKKRPLRMHHWQDNFLTQFLPVRLFNQKSFTPSKTCQEWFSGRTHLPFHDEYRNIRKFTHFTVMTCSLLCSHFPAF